MRSIALDGVLVGLSGSVGLSGGWVARARSRAARSCALTTGRGAVLITGSTCAGTCVYGTRRLSRRLALNASARCGARIEPSAQFHVARRRDGRGVLSRYPRGYVLCATPLLPRGAAT